MAFAAQIRQRKLQFLPAQSIRKHLDGDYAAFGHVTSGMDIVGSVFVAMCCRRRNEPDGKVGSAARVIESIRMVDRHEDKTQAK